MSTKYYTYVKSYYNFESENKTIKWNDDCPESIVYTKMRFNKTFSRQKSKTSSSDHKINIDTVHKQNGVN